MVIAEPENITKVVTTNEDGPNRLVFEPGYAAYLRSMNYKIRDVTDIDTVQSESNPDKKYLVAKIHTRDKPEDHPEMDYVADEVEISVCTCWNWRKEHSADLEDQSPSECGTCKHLISAYREERAKSDENQSELL